MIATGRGSGALRRRRPGAARRSTLPVEMVRYVEGRTDPLIAALSVVLIVATLVVVLVVERLVGVARAVGK